MTTRFSSAVGECSCSLFSWRWCGMSLPTERRPWTQAFMVAVCQSCKWRRETHSADDHEGQNVLAAARTHARRKGHYVQVKNGRVAHYGPSRPASSGVSVGVDVGKQ